MKLVAASVTSWSSQVGFGLGSEVLIPSVLLMFREHVLFISFSPLQSIPSNPSLLTIHSFLPSSVTQFGQSHFHSFEFRCEYFGSLSEQSCSRSVAVTVLHSF